jgi:hypothetical protein
MFYETHIFGQTPVQVKEVVVDEKEKNMYNLYHNIETADRLRSDGMGVIGAVAYALRMWQEERKAIILEVVLEKDHEIVFVKAGRRGDMHTINETITLVEADGRVTPRCVRDAGTVVKRFLQRTKDTRQLLCNISKVDDVLKNDARLKLTDQLQAVVECLYANKEEMI